MRNRLELTDRDLEILTALTHRVRVLTVQQISRTWWNTCESPEQLAQSRLKLLQRENLVQIQRAPAHPELSLRSPELSWKPGEAQPDFSSVSYRLQSRWSEHPVLTSCVSATAAAANRFHGYGGRFPRLVERTHDIHMAAVYLIYSQWYPGELSGWTFEEELRRRRRTKRERLPDALFSFRGKRKAVEFGGSYPRTKLQAFHLYCQDQNLPYEVW